MSGSMNPDVQLTEPLEDVQDTPDDSIVVEEHEVDENEDRADKPSTPGTSTNQPEDPAPISAKRPATSVQPQRAKHFKKTLLQKMVQLKERKVVQYEQRKQTTSEVQDLDYFFLMSLLPSLRAIPKNRKMQFRRKIEDLFLKEEEHGAQMNFFSYENQPLSSSVLYSENSTSVTENSDNSTSVVDVFQYDERTIGQLIPGFQP